MFNLGYPRLAMFKNMKACIDHKNYDCAADEMVNSNWCGQVGDK